jgi:hypothetical protein
MKTILFFGVLVISLLLMAGSASARGGGGHGGGRWGGRAYALGGVYGRPFYGYYGGYPYYSAWVSGYWTQECTPEYCRQVWVPGYWGRW